MSTVVYEHLTASQHYIEAERLLAKAQKKSRPGEIAIILQMAQVHATLATANTEPLGMTHDGTLIKVENTTQAELEPFDDYLVRNRRGL